MVVFHKKTHKETKASPPKNAVVKPPHKKSNFWAKTMDVLSKLSKAFLLPIALLPIAGIFLGIGAAISSNVAVGSGAWYFGTVLNKMGDVAFGNLPVLFAISTALAFSRDSGVAGITAVVGFLVMNGIQMALLHNNQVGTPNLVVWFENGKYNYDYATGNNKDIFTVYQFYYVPNLTSLPGPAESLELPDGAIRVDLNGMKLDDAGKPFYNLLWVNDIPNGLITANIGVTSLNTGVLAGIFVGAIAAWSYNRFHKTQLPAAISFFSGTKLVPIIAFFLVIPLSFIFIFIWPWVGVGLAKFGQVSGTLPVGLDSFIFEIIERSLVPFGLHHVYYSPLWWTNAGGSIAETFTNASDVWTQDANAVFGNSVLGGKWALQQWVDEYAKAFPNVVAGIPNWDTLGTPLAQFEAVRNVIANKADLWEAMGDQTMMFKVIANTDIINYTMLEHLGLNLGRFQSGKFGFMLLGLPLAALAMWLNVPKQNRKSVMGIYFSAAFTCFLTGITEPIEYTFLFLAPWLFYGVHMPLASIAFLLSGLMQTHVSMTVSGGIIDYIVFGLIPFFGSRAMTWLSVFGILFVAVGMAGLYFAAFYFAVKYGKVMVPGRETAAGGTDTKLFTKADYREKEGKAAAGGAMSEWTTSTNRAEVAKYEKAAKIVEYLGGEKNIVNIDACASRLRVDVKDSTKVDKNGIMSLGGATGVLVKGTNVQAVYGGEQEAIKPRMIEILGIQRKGGGQKQALAAQTERTLDTTKPENYLVLVDEKMMVDCPNCGQKFKVELTNVPVHHHHQKSAAKDGKASKPKAAPRKKPTRKKTNKPKTLLKKEDTVAFVAGLNKKYNDKFKKAKAENAEKIKTQKNAKERAKLDGSIDVTESRQELQKHVSALRRQAKEEKINLGQGNLREMTKKEVIRYLGKALEKMN